MTAQRHNQGIDDFDAALFAGQSGATDFLPTFLVPLLLITLSEFLANIKINL